LRKYLKMKILINYSLILIFVLGICSCAGLIESVARGNIAGLWNATTIVDDKTGVVSNINISSVNTILGNKRGDGIVFNDDGTFSVFRQVLGNNSIVSGNYDIDVVTLSLTFTNEKTIKRRLVEVGETKLIMADTILGVPKTVTYLR
jgi:hypothetical protein